MNILNKINQQILNGEYNDMDTVFVFQCSRKLGLSELFFLEAEIKKFLNSWTAHEETLYAKVDFFLGQFIAVIVDERQTKLSGCSKDKLMKCMQTLENRIGISFFDRQLLAFIIKDKIELLPLNHFEYAFKNKMINEDTLYFNNTIQNIGAFKKKWLIPIKKSWLQNNINIALV